MTGVADEYVRLYAPEIATVKKSTGWGVGEMGAGCGWVFFIELKHLKINFTKSGEK